MGNIIGFSPKVRRGLLAVSCAAVSFIALSTSSNIPRSQPFAYVQPMALSNTDLESGGVKGYRPWFESLTKQGDLVEYDISVTEGIVSISTSVDLSTEVPGNNGNNWSARLQFTKAEIDSNYWQQRNIFTLVNGQQVAFRWPNLSSIQKSELDNPNKNNSTSAVLDFIRGDRSQESTFRVRKSLLGDIVHSNPVYVQSPKDNYTDSEYVDFRNTNIDRKAMIYVGANDGMLHAFEASTGKELFAYIPSMLIPYLAEFTDPSYQHRYYVDGEISVFDSKIGGNWRTVLTGTLGAGGKGSFALDITNPDSPKVLWENTVDASQIGYSFSKSAAVELDNGQYYIVSGNGHFSEKGQAALIVTDMRGVSQLIEVGSADAASPNGLSSPAVIDSDGDGNIDTAYAGDIKGNLWKFDLNNRSAYKLFNGDQPITTTPEVARHPNNGFLVYFGTGKAFTEEDLKDSTPQSIIGVWDQGKNTNISKNNLITQSLELGQSANGKTVGTLSGVGIDYKKDYGWKIDLTGGFRLLTDPQLRAERLHMTITDPLTSTNYILEPNYLHGGAPKSTIYDTNGDGFLDKSDHIKDGSKPSDIPAAIKIGDGLMSRPVIARVSQGIDTKFVNSVVPPITEIEEGCVDNCDNGFIGGHIDVDTDRHRSGSTSKWYGGIRYKFAGSTGHHTHEYDKRVKQVFTDLINLSGGSQVDIDEAISGNKPIFLIAANADMSRDAVLTIGKVKYNLVAYQKMIQQKLASWNGNLDSLKDDQGNSLIFTLNDIKNSNGQLRISFNDQSLGSGGLVPLDSSCVRDQLLITNDRWRNGALTVQAIDPRSITNLSGLHIQKPSDLPEKMVAGGQEHILKDGTNIYGGLRAIGSSNRGKDFTDTQYNAKNNGFLWELSLFWHFNRNNGSDPKWGKLEMCYGDVRPYKGGFHPEGSYDQAVREIRDNVVSQILLQKSGISGVNNLQQANDKLQQLLAQTSCNATCQNQVTELKVAIGRYNQNAGNLAEINEQTTITSILMEGRNESPGIMSGPNFKIGRRSWIDLSKE